MATPITFPPIQNGVYYISTLYPEFYLELQRDSTLRAMKLNMYSDAQKWNIIPVEDGTYQITCIQGHHELPCETYHAHNRLAHHKAQLWTIDPRGTSFMLVTTALVSPPLMVRD
ncbi:hypothetical protein PILCRDRAFT_684061 [Piloderma croceum F 1598]|uniref:Ricin B lectin domain-containing protein n=1 Tax=Piloderma croceum (strain F 1598) TaxID=765440 RepID=A0A0C3F5V1_PILCF|nr:hypothetical protein PILCRDRAFT_684061 [Piloderma croceum F 1598]